MSAPFYYVFIKIPYLDLFPSENVSVAQGINIDDSTEWIGTSIGSEGTSGKVLFFGKWLSILSVNPEPISGII